MFRKVPQAGIGITKHGVPADRPMGEVPSAPPTPVGIPILPANSVAFIGEVVADLPRAPPSRLTAEPATLTGGLLAVPPPLAAPTAPAALTGKLRCTTPTPGSTPGLSTACADGDKPPPTPPPGGMKGRGTTGRGRGRAVVASAGIGKTTRSPLGSAPIDAPPADVSERSDTRRDLFKADNSALYGFMVRFELVAFLDTFM